MRKNFRKSLSLLMALCMMVLSMLPTTAYAAPRKADTDDFHIMRMDDIKHFVAAENKISDIGDIEIYSITVHGAGKDCIGTLDLPENGYNTVGDTGLPVLN